MEDTSIPAAVREELAQEFRDIEAISEKLRHGEIHIAAFGRVGHRSPYNVALPHPEGSRRLEQNALFKPRGLAGIVYWYAVVLYVGDARRELRELESSPSH